MVLVMVKNLVSKNMLLLMFSGMTKITWLYALTCILYLVLELPLFPLLTAILAFFTPIIITYSLKDRGRMIIEYVLIHIFLYLIILLYTFYFYGNWTESFLGFQWLKMILNKQYGAVDGIAYILIIFWISIYWRYGYITAHHSNDYYEITSGFDLGIVVLVVTFIILGAADMTLPYSKTLIIYYFLFGMFFLTKNKGNNF